MAHFATAQHDGKYFLIEHLEPGVELEAWALTEYAHCVNYLLPPQATLILCGLGKLAKGIFPESFHALNPPNILDNERVELVEAEGPCRLSIFSESVTEILPQLGLAFERICLLDPAAPKALSSEDCKLFDGFLFGGILGDDPPRDRTSILRSAGFPSRHLGPVQMTTDTAVGVTARVIIGQENLNEDWHKLTSEAQKNLDPDTGLLRYVDYPDIPLRKGESISMPFRYLDARWPSAWRVRPGHPQEPPSPTPTPLLPPGMLKILENDLDRGFLD